MNRGKVAIGKLNSFGDFSDRTTTLGNDLKEMLGAEKAARLEERYFLDVRKKIDLLFRSLEQKDMAGIRKIAHQLKGSGKSYGFPYVSDAGSALSACAKQEDYAELNLLIHHLDEWLKARGN